MVLILYPEGLFIRQFDHYRWIAAGGLLQRAPQPYPAKPNLVPRNSRTGIASLHLGAEKTTGIRPTDPLASPEAVVCYPKPRIGRQVCMGAKDIVVFESSDGDVSLPVRVDARNEEIWLNRRQLAALYGRDVKTIGKHIASALAEELSGLEDSTVAKFETVQMEGDRKVKRRVEHYGLDVVLSVGYRVKSKRGIEFRRWANDVLRRYILQGRAENEKRLRQLGEVAGVIRRLDGGLEAGQVLDVIESYTAALDMLDDYDHQKLSRPEGSASTYILSYEECRTFIDRMRFGVESNLFGNEKDESFKGSIGSIYQGFGGQDLYPSVEEKAANLLYFVVKNHSFSDGNKRIAAGLFLYFLDKNAKLFADGRKRLDDSTLVAVTIMIAESRPEEKEAMVSLVMNFLVGSR